MKLARTFTLILALAGASTALADTPAKAPPAGEKKAEPPKAELSAADVAKVEKFFNEFVDAIVKNQDSCPKMATAINSVFTANEAWLSKLADSGKDLPESAKERMAKRNGEMMGAAMKCKDDKDVNTAMMRFTSLGAKKKKAPEPNAKPAEAKPAEPKPAPPAKK